MTRTCVATYRTPMGMMEIHYEAHNAGQAWEIARAYLPPPWELMEVGVVMTASEIAWRETEVWELCNARDKMERNRWLKAREWKALRRAYGTQATRLSIGQTVITL